MIRQPQQAPSHLRADRQDWTGTLLRDYPYDPADGREATANPPDARRVLRCGSWNFNRNVARGAARDSNLPSLRSLYGFVLVCVRAPQVET